MINPVSSYLALFGISNPSAIFTDLELKKFGYYLSHTHEEDGKARNVHGNWDFSQAGAKHKSPFLDEFVCKRLSEKGIGRKSIWPDGAPFAVFLSHDVDRTEAYSPRNFCRTLRKRIKHAKRANEKVALWLNFLKTSAKAVLLPKENDPLWCYERWADMEAEFGYFSTYYFFVRPELNDLALWDCDYLLTDRMRYRAEEMSVIDYIRILTKRGDEIGLHGSYLTSEDPELFSKQKRGLEKAVGQKVISTRQHFLHADAAVTPGVQRSADIFTDSTLGFTTSPGYRAGTCYPYFIQTEAGTLLEVPLILMDVALLRNCDVDLTKAKAEIDVLIRQVEAVGGCFTVNFHPDYVVNKIYFESYRYILSEVHKRGAAIMRAKDINKQVCKCVESKDVKRN